MGAEGRLLCYKDLVERTGLSRATLIRAKQRGELACYRIGTRTLFGEHHLADFLFAREVKGEAKTAAGAAKDGNQ